jgi:hypothetical protein
MTDDTNDPAAKLAESSKRCRHCIRLRAHGLADMCRGHRSAFCKMEREGAARGKR